MKVTHQAVSHANSILDRIDRSTDTFTKTPELFNADFWELVHLKAEDPRSAQMVLNEMNTLSQEGVMISPYINKNLTHAMWTARKTLTNQMIHNHIKLIR